eukprot:1186410-Prorocentrum_minimum.AAC.2
MVTWGCAAAGGEQGVSRGRAGGDRQGMSRGVARSVLKLESFSVPLDPPRREPLGQQNLPVRLKHRRRRQPTRGGHLYTTTTVAQSHSRTVPRSRSCSHTRRTRTRPLDFSTQITRRSTAQVSGTGEAFASGARPLLVCSLVSASEC